MNRENFNQFIETAKELSPKLTDAISAIGPLPPLKQSSELFSIRLSRAVAGQQLSVKAASSIWQRVLDSHEDQAFLEFLDYTSVEHLRSCGLSGAKCKTLKAISLAQKQGLLCEKLLGELSSAERTKHLVQIWGIGQWTADMMGISYFADTDIWPDGDVTARKTLSKLTSPRRKTVLTAKRFSPYRSYLALYMWKTADAKPA